MGHRLARKPFDVGFYQTEHHKQIVYDLRSTIMGGCLIALTAGIDLGTSLLVRRMREALTRENRVIVSRAPSLQKTKITMPLLVSALFYNLSTDKLPALSRQAERRERDLQELFCQAKKPVALFVDHAQDLHANTLNALKRLVALVQ